MRTRRCRFHDKSKLAAEAAATVKAFEQVRHLPMFRQNTAAFVHELPSDASANIDGDSHYVLVQALTNAGALDRKKQIDVVQRLTELVAAAARDDSLKQ